MKNTLLIIFLISLFACKPPSETPIVNPDFETYENHEYHEPWNDPAIIQGSSFGHFMQQLYKQGRFDEMLNFTSKQSIALYGKDSILDYYKSIDFGYDMELKSKFIKENITTLNYESVISGSKRITRLDVVIENDTCRLLLDNTLFHLGITWEIAYKNN